MNSSTLLAFARATRRMGNTTALVECSKQTGATIVTASSDYAKSLSRQYRVPVKHLGSERNWEEKPPAGPYLVDIELVIQAGNKLQDAESVVDRLCRQNEDMKTRVKEVEQALFNEQAKYQWSVTLNQRLRERCDLQNELLYRYDPLTHLISFGGGVDAEDILNPFDIQPNE